MVAPSPTAVRKRAATFTPMAQALASPATAQGAQAAAYGGPAGQTDSRRAFAQALAGEAISGGPVAGPLGAIAQALKGAIAGGIEKKADRQDMERSQALAQALQGANGDPTQIMGVLGQQDPKLLSQYALAKALQPAQEKWETTTDPLGRPAQRSTLSGKLDVLPAPPQAPDWQNPDFLRYEEGRDARDHAQAVELARLQAAIREQPTMWGQVIDMPGIGPVQVSSRGELKPLRQNLPDAPFSEPFQMEGVEGLVQKGPKGEIKQVQGSEPPKIDQKQIDAAGYATRMATAEEKLTQMEQGGYAPGTWQGIVGNAPEGMQPFLSSDTQKEYDAAAAEWIAANLRKESQGQIGKQAQQTVAKAGGPATPSLEQGAPENDPLGIR
jgi:hypothetical protein